MSATYGTIGTISHGTLRSEDLLHAFASELEHLDKQEAVGKTDLEKTNDAAFKAWLAAQVTRAKLVELARSIDPDSDEAFEVVNELIDALQEYAPPYCYFGANEGDGSNFGFWPNDDWQQDATDNGALLVADTAEVSKGYSGEVVHVNDHGNATLYTAENGKLTEVWAIV